MRKPTFLLIVIAILLAGAMTAGFAAYTVVAPKTGKVVSAGPVSIPTVLGQSAEEVLFYPWSMYDTMALRTLTDEELFYDMNLFSLFPDIQDISDIDDVMEMFDEYPELFDKYMESDQLYYGLHSFLPELSYSHNDLIHSLMCNDMQKLGYSGFQFLFLKDFPAVLKESNVPVTMNMSFSNDMRIAFSFLLKPQNPEEIAEEDLLHAKEKVEQDLRDLFLQGTAHEPEPKESKSKSATKKENLPVPSFESELAGVLNGFGEIDPVSNFLNDTVLITDMIYQMWPDPEQVPMNQLLGAIPSTGWSIQMIDTQQQIVLQFSYMGAVFGLYYDVQLGMYSGFGMTVS